MTVMLLNTNADGELQWTNTFGGSSRDTALDIKLDNEGNIIVVGKIVKTATFSDGEMELMQKLINTNCCIKIRRKYRRIIWKSIDTWIFNSLNHFWHTDAMQMTIKRIIKFFLLVNRMVE